MKLQALLSALITAAFLSTTLGSIIYSESAIAEDYADAFVKCQLIKPGGKSNKDEKLMKMKLDCMKNLLLEIDGRSSAFDECEEMDATPRQNYYRLRDRKDCFRDAAWDSMSDEDKDDVPEMLQPNMDNTDNPVIYNMDEPTTADPLYDRGASTKECDALSRKMTNVKPNQVNTQAARDLFAKYERLCNR
jgi:hypothetical protein